MGFIRYEDLPDILYVSDVAEYLRLSERAVRHHIETGSLRHRRIGGRIIVPKRFLKEFVVGVDA